MQVIFYLIVKEKRIGFSQQRDQRQIDSDRDGEVEKNEGHRYAKRGSSVSKRY